MMVQWIALILCFWLLSGCGSFQRHSGSDHLESSPDFTYRNIKREKAKYIFAQTAAELGINPNQRLTPNEVARVRMRLHLKQLERSIPTTVERQQYFKYKPLLRTDRERISFLKVMGYEKREQWIQMKKIVEREQNFTPEEQNLIQSNDITLGMSQIAVKESWGEPESIDIAGNPLYKNERWLYSKYTPSPDGYQKENRIIYFESGRVVGWEQR